MSRLSGPPESFSPDAVGLIRQRLDDVRAQGVTVLLAVESGSRAWGFPSPDSDYDCRFVYARTIADHLRLEPPRDVIEFPIEGETDASGWDLQKALKLALSSNAALVEWVNSPIAYEEVPGFRERLAELLDLIADPAGISRHYLGLARSQMDRLGDFDGVVKIKKLFYLIRPIVAVEWMRQRDFRALPPMNLPQILEAVDIPSDVRREIESLMVRKASTRELGEGAVPATLGRYLKDRFEHGLGSGAAGRGLSAEPGRRDLAERFYRAEIERIAR